jgi:hypothetical protein
MAVYSGITDELAACVMPRRNLVVEFETDQDLSTLESEVPNQAGGSRSVRSNRAGMVEPYPRRYLTHSHMAAISPLLKVERCGNESTIKRMNDELLDPN